MEYIIECDDGYLYEGADGHFAIILDRDGATKYYYDELPDMIKIEEYYTAIKWCWQCRYYLTDYDVWWARAIRV